MATTENPIDEAKVLIHHRVFDPALRHEHIGKETKNIVKNSVRWVQHCERIGDLDAYLQCCINAPAGRATYRALKAHGLQSFEDVLPDLRSRFAAYLNDRLSISDLVPGAKYSSFQFNILGERYDNRSGGILPIGRFPKHTAIAVKGTLAGGVYSNGWIEPGRRLRYFLKKRGIRFSERFVENRSIIDFPHLPVAVFVREKPKELFTYAGEFRCVAVHREADDSKWFELVVRHPAMRPIEQAEYDRELAEQVERSRRATPDERRARLATAPSRPKQALVVTQAYIRNADVIAEVLDRAKGVCEACLAPAPFSRRSDGTPYLEVHHKTPLAEGGDDTVENAVALCPNCHRREHYGSPRLQGTR